MYILYSSLKELHLFFAGFGNISPHTEGGRIFCIIYALLGIPLFGFLLAGVGDQLGTIFGKGIAKVEKMFVVSLLLKLDIWLGIVYLFLLIGTVKINK